MTIIGISGNLLDPEPRRFYTNKKLHIVEADMVRLVERHGQTPIILPVQNDEKNIVNLVNIIDGLILSGGIDISCELYGEELINESWRGHLDRDHFEIALLNEAKKQQKPILGICRGCQLINVAYKGSLYQDVLLQQAVKEKHRCPDIYDKLGHNVSLLENKPLRNVFQKEEIYVNTIHHQAVKELGEGLEIMAYSHDGLIEAIYDPAYHFLWGVQWHPEWMQQTEQDQLYQAFIKAIK